MYKKVADSADKTSTSGTFVFEVFVNQALAALFFVCMRCTSLKTVPLLANAWGCQSTVITMLHTPAVVLRCDGLYVIVFGRNRLVVGAFYAVCSRGTNGAQYCAALAKRSSWVRCQQPWCVFFMVCLLQPCLWRCYMCCLRRRRHCRISVPPISAGLAWVHFFRSLRRWPCCWP